MFQNFILNAGVSASEIRRRMEIFCRVTQVFLTLPNAPAKIDTYTWIGLIPVVIVVITAHRINASIIAAIRIRSARYQGSALLFTI